MDKVITDLNFDDPIPDELGARDQSEGQGYDPDDLEADGYVLEYVDDDEISPPYSEALLKATDVLGEFSFDEILDMNGADLPEVLALLYQTGELGIPIPIDDEEVSDTPPEEIEE